MEPDRIPSFPKIGTGHLPLRVGGLTPHIDNNSSICQDSCQQALGKSFSQNHQSQRQEHRKGFGVGVGGGLVATATEDSLAWGIGMVDALTLSVVLFALLIVRGIPGRSSSPGEADLSE